MGAQAAKLRRRAPELSPSVRTNVSIARFAAPTSSGRAERRDHGEEVEVAEPCT
jgi:hypothetical protein